VAEQPKPLHIVRLEAKNVKRLKAVRITPEGNIVPITGRNGAGKSSVLDSIEMAMAGKSAQPAEPVRRGAKKASVVLDLGDLVVKRTWTAGGGTNLTVESANGAKFPSPQKMLDELVGRLTFDPVAFREMKPAERVATLKDVAGLTDLYAKLDAKRQQAYDERRDVNRDVKALEAQVAGLADVDAPDEEVNLATLTDRHRAATDQIRVNDKLRQEAEQWTKAIGSADKRVKEMEAQLQEAKTHLADMETKAVAANKKARELKDPDLDAIAAELRGAEATNALVRQKHERATKATTLADLQAHAMTLTEQIEQIDIQKQGALADAELPVDGLGFGDEDVTLNGLPFEQASSAEALRASVAIGAALNPKFRAMRIEHGNLLDRESRKLLAKLATEQDLQLWIEFATDGENVGIVIEDGEVVHEPK